MVDSTIEVRWSSRSLHNSVEIRDFLLRKFTEKEVKKFYGLLHNFELIVQIFPELYPTSIREPEIRKAVLSKRLSVYYTYSSNLVQIIAVKDNRQDE